MAPWHLGGAIEIVGHNNLLFRFRKCHVLRITIKLKTKIKTQRNYCIDKLPQHDKVNNILILQWKIAYIETEEIHFAEHR